MSNLGKRTLRYLAVSLAKDVLPKLATKAASSPMMKVLGKEVTGAERVSLHFLTYIEITKYFNRNLGFIVFIQYII